VSAMRDDDVVSFAESLQWQMRVCAKAGAPVAAAILGAIGDAHKTGAIPNEIDLQHRVRFGDFVPLRLLAAVHALALDRRAPHLALHLPTLGGTAGTPVTATDIAAAFAAEAAWVNEYLHRTPQTNEVGRAHPLRIALAHLGSSQPTHLREIGCSAGLLLNADRMQPMPGEKVRQLPPIRSRIGFDLHPVDASSPAGRLLLSSYVWPDHVERFRRLGDAIVITQKCPVDIQVMDAASAVEQLTLEPGTTTLVWHSALWPYLSVDGRARLERAFAAVGSTAKNKARFAVASWEVDSHAVARRLSFTLTMRTWCDGVVETQVLATGNSHATEVAEVAAQSIDS